MGLFQTTRWSLILQTRDAHADQALEELCKGYRAPVLSYIRRSVKSRSNAEDLTQAFFERLLIHRVYAKADPERGSFRAFLLTALRRFLISADAASHTAKRGGYAEQVPFPDASDSLDADEWPSDETPESVFDRAFALAVLRKAMARLEAEAAAAGKATQFAALQSFISEEPAAGTYEKVGQDLHVRANTVAVIVHRLRQRLSKLVRLELDDTVDSPDAARAELARLRVALGKVASG